MVLYRADIKMNGETMSSGNVNGVNPGVHGVLFEVKINREVLGINWSHKVILTNGQKVHRVT